MPHASSRGPCLRCGPVLPQSLCDARHGDRLARFHDLIEDQRRFRFLAQLRLARVGHSHRRDVKAAAPDVWGRDAWDLPDAPDALTFVEAAINDVVLGDVAFHPATFAVSQGVMSAHHKPSHPISALTTERTGAEGQLEFHHVPAWECRLDEETGPCAAGKARVRF